MNPVNALEYFNQMNAADMLLCYRGRVSKEFLEAIYAIVETDHEEEGRLQFKKRLFNILIECLQNIYHHNPRSADEDADSIFMIAKEKDQYKIVTGNYVLLSNIEQLQNSLDKINSLSADELKAFYREQLSNSKFSDKGTAGLGFIDIARRAKSKLLFRFDTIDQQYSFFSLTIFIQ